VFRSLLRKNFNLESSILSRKKCTHEICSRKDKCVVDLISNATAEAAELGEDAALDEVAALIEE